MMTEDVEINIDWTLKSIKKTRAEGESKPEICFGCSKEHVQIKSYEVAVLNHNLQWTDASGGVYEKLKVQYCDACIDELINEMSEKITN